MESRFEIASYLDNAALGSLRMSFFLAFVLGFSGFFVFFFWYWGRGLLCYLANCEESNPSEGVWVTLYFLSQPPRVSLWRVCWDFTGKPAESNRSCPHAASLLQPWHLLEWALLRKHIIITHLSSGQQFRDTVILVRDPCVFLGFTNISDLAYDPIREKSRESCKVCWLICSWSWVLIQACLQLVCIMEPS